jgi:hypothetical protein
MDNKKMENDMEWYFKYYEIGKQRNGKQKWKTNNNITYSQVK